MFIEIIPTPVNPTAAPPSSADDNAAKTGEKVVKRDTAAATEASFSRQGKVE